MNPNQPYKNYKNSPNYCIDLNTNKCNETCPELYYNIGDNKIYAKKYFDFYFIINN